MEVALLGAIGGLIALSVLFAIHVKSESKRVIEFAKEALTMMRVEVPKMAASSHVVSVPSSQPQNNEDEIAPASFSADLMKHGTATDEEGHKWGLG